MSRLFRGIPVLGPVAFTAFRVSLAVMLGALLLFTWEGDLPLDSHRDVPIAAVPWLRAMAAQPGVIEWLQRGVLAGLVLFAAGVRPRLSFLFVALGFNLWFCLLSLRGNIHFLGPLPLALLLLIPTPWHEGSGIGSRGAVAGRTPRVPPGYGPWVLCLAFAVAFAAAGYAKGAQWAMNGTVRYHFMADADVAWVSIGPWIAARPALAVGLSAVVVIVEQFAVVTPFLTPGLRAVAGVPVALMIAGFVVMHDALWPAWWTLLLGFVPWHLIGRRHPGPRVVAATVGAPLVVLVPLVVLPLQQVAASVFEIEAGPYLSAYDMYSTTFESPEAFEREDGRPRFRMRAVTADGDVDIGACVREDEQAFLEMEAAVSAGPGRELPHRAVSRSLECGRQAGGTRVRIEADQRFFDWQRGATGWKFRDRIVGDWPL
ncbi:MAG: hypothetical protein AB7I25_13885 [Vicinamibacterales bacterium]